MTVTGPAPLVGVLLAISGVAVAVGSVTVGTGSTLVVVGLAAMAVIALFALRHPTLVMVALVVAEVTNFATVTGLPILTPLIGLGVLTVANCLRKRAMRQRLNRWTVVGIGLICCYLIANLPAVLASQEFSISLVWLRETVLDCVFFGVVLMLAQLTRRPWAIAQAFVVSLTLLSLLCLANEVVFGGAQSFGGFATVTTATAELITTPRYAGPLADSNFWGRHLIMGLPLAAALAVRAVASGRRSSAVVWFLALLSLFAGVYLTQSRGTMISAVVVMILWVLASGPKARRKGLLSLPLLALLLLLPGVGNRLVSLAEDLLGTQQNQGVDLSVLQRTSAQEMAWEMFRDRPFFGVGPNVFEALVPSYAGRVTTAVLRPTTGAHNLYAELAGESGMVGLLGWTILVGSVFVLLAIHVIRIPHDLKAPDRSMAAAVLAALVGWSVASIFLHLAYFRTFAIILALALALVSLGSRAEPPEAVETPSSSGVLARLGVSAALGTLAAAGVLLATGTQTQVASQAVTLLPTEQIMAHYAYGLDVRSRDVVVPTYASLISTNMPNLNAVADPVRGVITLSVENQDLQTARMGLDIAWANAFENLAKFRLDNHFTVSTVGPIQYDSKIVHSSESLFAAAGAGVAVMALLLMALRPPDARTQRLEQGTLFARVFSSNHDEDNHDTREVRMVTCANGHPCRDDLRFCGECGIPISPHTALCAYGHINPEENTFCGDCGAPVAPPVLTRSKQTHGRWMVDPTSRHQFRYLAGSRWTHHVADIGEGSLSVDPVPRAWRSQAASRAGLVAAVVLALLVAAVAIAGATFSRLGQAAQPSPEGQPAVAVPTAVPPAEYLPTPTTARPFAIIGAPCSPTSVNGVQRDGTPAYCEPLEGTTTYLWSMYWGPIESPYPPGTPAADREDPSIAVCMAQRDLTRQACIAELP